MLENSFVDVLAIKPCREAFVEQLCILNAARPARTALYP